MTYLLDCSSCIVHVIVLFVSDSVKLLPWILCKNVIKYPCPNLSGRSSIVDNLKVHSCLAYPYRAVVDWKSKQASASHKNGRYAFKLSSIDNIYLRCKARLIICCYSQNFSLLENNCKFSRTWFMRECIRYKCAV